MDISLLLLILTLIFLLYYHFLREAPPFVQMPFVKTVSSKTIYPKTVCSNASPCSLPEQTLDNEGFSAAVPHCRNYRNKEPFFSSANRPKKNRTVFKRVSKKFQAWHTA